MTEQRDDRDAFEAAYANHMTESLGIVGAPKALASLREGDGYPAEYSYLSGCWSGWKLARAALSQPQSQAQGEAVASNKSEAYSQRTLVADAIIDAYKEHYDFPPQGESHMHDCIMEELDIRNAAPVAATQAPHPEYTRGWQDCLEMHIAPEAKRAAASTQQSEPSAAARRCEHGMDLCGLCGHPAPSASPAPHGWRERLDEMREASYTISQYPETAKVVFDSVIDALDELDAAASTQQSELSAGAQQEEPLFYADAASVRAIANGRNGHKDTIISVRRDEAVHQSDVPLYAAPVPSASPAALTILGPDEDGFPIERFSHRSTGMLAHPNGTYVRYGEVERRIKLASQPSEARDAEQPHGDDPDMFWNNDDPERCQDSIHNVVVEAYENGSNVGDTVEVQQAIRLHNIKVRIIQDPDDSEEVTYELVEDAALAAQREGGV